MRRSSGIFLHITSLPSRFGIGDLGSDAKKWIDTLAQADQSIWQICPVGPVGYGFSPYMTLSAFAGNPMLISPQVLLDWGYLTEEDVSEYPNFSNSKVEFEKISAAKDLLFKKAFANFESNSLYEEFKTVEAYWLEDFVLYMTLSDHYKTTKWTTWDSKHKIHDENTLNEWQITHKEELEYYRFVQFIIQSQWFDVKSYAHDHGVKIFGDVPYYVAYESSDVWGNQELFELDDNGDTIRVGGVPPDYFSEDGQLWGNPLYRWDIMKSKNFDWWVKRFKRSFYYNDLVRIDHFRAFESFWAIPGDSDTAKVGEWVEGPGHDFFEVIKRELGDVDLIAEDLGIITDKVISLRIGENMPGMKILQFAFDGNKDNWYLPFNCGQQSVMYTGTHDNDTTLGWFNSLDDNSKAKVTGYFGCNNSDVVPKMNREVLSSVSNMAILPLQDVLVLDSSARFNIPGTVEDNWSWRFDWSMIDSEKLSLLKTWTNIFGRAK